jgi:hypothetical protein
MRPLIALGDLLTVTNLAFGTDLRVRPIVRTPICGTGNCGTIAGPGYRGPDGKCVSPESLGRICGDPPTTGCKEECVLSNIHFAE